MTPICVGVLTVSDRCTAGVMADRSGPSIVELLTKPQFETVVTAIVPDSIEEIARTLVTWTDDLKCDVILTTGGTGFAPRDVTPEATAQVIQRYAANLAAYLASESSKITPYAALGRGIAGIRAETLIVNLPGSPKGAREQLNMLIRLLPHAVMLMKGVDAPHTAS